MNRYPWRREWSMRLAIGIALVALAPMHAQAQTAGTPMEQDGDAVPSDADLANTNCTGGEERFLLEWDGDSNEVWYDLLAFSRPNQFLARVGYPFARRLQKRFVAESKLEIGRAHV